jgi:surface protein
MSIRQEDSWVRHAKFGVVMLFITFGFGILSENICQKAEPVLQTTFTTVAPRASDPSSFISMWDTTRITSWSSLSNQVKLPLYSGGTYNFNVNWGDGTSNTITAWNQAEVTHTYAATGIYTINITGTINGFRFNDEGDKLKILDIQQWGNLKLGNLDGYFLGCRYLNVTATDAPNLEETTSLKWMFTYCYDFNGDIGHWDVSHVVNMTAMFGDCTTFNQDISGWNVSSVTDMRWMFSDAYLFNCSIGGWDVSHVVNMHYMFNHAEVFNQDIGGWNVSRATNMYRMFAYAQAFNQDIGDWNVSSVTRMEMMFYSANAFDQDISRWNVTKVTTMASMFAGTPSFNQDISQWNVSMVTTMASMFAGALSFNQDISQWNVSMVTTMASMFSGALSFYQDISRWNVTKVTTMASMFIGAGLSTIDYDKLLVAWSKLNLRTNVPFGAGSSKYTPNSPASIGRQKLTNSTINGGFAWVITDGGIQPDIQLPTWNQQPQNQILLLPNSFSYDVNASDNAAIHRYWVNDTTHFQANPATGIITNITTLALGTYHLRIYVNDTNGNVINANITVQVVEDVPPTWDQAPQNQIIPIRTNFLYNINASDNGIIDRYWLNDTTHFQINPTTGLITNTTTLNPGTYHLAIHVNDTCGNEISAAISITVVDNISPTWTETPQNQSIPVKTSFIYNVNATDNWALDRYWLNNTAHFQIDPATGVITNKTALNPGVHHLSIHVNDTHGNDINANITITVVDTIPPAWVQVPQNQARFASTSFTYDVNATDNWALDCYWLNDTVHFQINPTTGLISNKSVLGGGVYHLSIHVNDTCGNDLNANITITITDDMNPAWIQTPQNKIVQVETNFVYDVNASDNTAVDRYWLNDTTQFQINPASGLIINTTTLVFGSYHLMIHVNDTNGNEIAKAITISVVDSIAPTWLQSPQNRVLPVLTSFTHDVNASDNWAVDKYWINDTTRFQVNPANGLITNKTLLPPALYHLRISVNDTSGNVLSTTITITVVDSVAPAWVQTPQNRNNLASTSFVYDVNASDNWAIHRYWLNDTTRFQVNPTTGVITYIGSVTSLAVYHVMISVNDTSGNTISASITITNVDDVLPTWNSMPQNRTVYIGHNFQYFVTASDNVHVGRYWLDENYHFAITQGGLIENLDALALGDYSIIIHVNDTSGNVISVSVTISVVREPTPDDVPFYTQPWFYIVVIGAVIGLGVVMGLGRKGKKNKPRDANTLKGDVKGAKASGPSPAPPGVPGRDATALTRAPPAAMVTGQNAPTTAPVAIPAIATPSTATMFCPTCSQRTSVPNPVDLATVTCGTCNGPLSRLISCPHCKGELFIDKDFYTNHGGSQIACSTCNKQFVLRFD